MNATRRSDHFQTHHHPSKQGGARATRGAHDQYHQRRGAAASDAAVLTSGGAVAVNTGGRNRIHGTEQRRNKNLHNQYGNNRNIHANSQPGRNPDPSNSAPPMEQSLKCMTAVEEGSRIAFACYDEEKNEILLEESPYGSPDSSCHDLEAIVQTFISFARPNLLLISSKVASNALLLDFLTRNPTASSTSSQLRPNGEQQQQGNRITDSMHVQNNVSTQNTSSPVKIPYQLLKSKSFDLKHCKHIILHKLRVMSLIKRTRGGQQTHDNDLVGGISLGGIDAAAPMQLDGRPSSNYHSIASIVNFDSTCLLRALGSLLCFLQGTVFRLEEGNTITINSINYARSSQYMRIDKDTLHALHIFSTEHHPVIAKGPGKDKEGFSLFTLLDRTKSKMGRECLREWMMKPLLEPTLIRERQNGVALFLHPFCREISDSLLNHLSKVGAVDKIIQKMQKCHSVPMDFIVLSRTLVAATAIYGTLNGELRNRIMYEYRQGMFHDDQSVDGETPAIWQEFAVIEQIMDNIHVSVLQDLHDRIVSIVDQEATLEAKESVVIHYGFHEELDNAKEIFDNLDETLSRVGSEVLEKYPALTSLKVVFLPQVGFLIAVDKRNHVHDIATNEFPDLPPDFSYVFIQEDEAFFKNPDMRRLDDEIGDLDAFIKDTEKIIVSELEEDILDCECELRCTFSALATLDCLLAFANCAADHNFVRPEIIELSEDPSSIFIENGRHPLQELIVNNEFIPNNTDVDNSRRINIVTGPNFSGKSCYIRQVGMLVFMSHIGSYIPCDRARISITDQILARISSIETCAVPQSSFQLDLTQMATILHRSTPRSVVLIDEFGKGTSPVSGIAVLTAALKKLMTIGCSVICTTHFLEIFSLKLLSDGQDSVKVLHMAVHISDSDDDESAVPLFKLEDGTAKSSAGVICAKMAGVHRTVISRAREILGALKNGHQVKPIPAKLNSNSVFQAPAKRALRHFLAKTSWTDESDAELEALQRDISLM